MEQLARDAAPIAGLATAHIGAAEQLAATAAETGIARLWQESAGEAAARFCHELIDAAGDFPAIPGRHYPALFEALAAGIVVRPAFGRHPRLAIWGLVEARLQQADLLVLGGLNEGTWPGSAASIRGCRGRCGGNSASPCRSRRSASPRTILRRRSARRRSLDPGGAARGRADDSVALAVAARRGIARDGP